MAEGKTIKNEEKIILSLLRALWGPKKLAIIYCPGHPNGKTPSQRKKAQ